jgi:hypothetical protein
VLQRVGDASTCLYGIDIENGVRGLEYRIETGFSPFPIPRDCNGQSDSIQHHRVLGASGGFRCMECFAGLTFVLRVRQ